MIFNRLHKDLLVGLGRIGRDWEDLGKLEGLEQIVDWWELSGSGEYIGFGRIGRIIENK